MVARQQCSTYLFNRLCPYLFRYHPRRSAPCPSFPKEGTTLAVRADTGVCPYGWMLWRGKTKEAGSGALCLLVLLDVLDVLLAGG